MARSTSPAVSRRWLALELRRLREAMGLAQREVGKRCGFSGARLSYLETGTQAVVDDDLDQLLPLYEVPPSRRAEFYDIAAHAREKGWWERYDGRTAPDWFAQFVGLEQGATVIRAVEPTVVPGLLQTAEYASAIVELDLTPRTPRQIKYIVEFRMARQARLDSLDVPLLFHVVIDESVLRRIVGNEHLMRGQLDRLVERAQQPNIHLQVFPFSRGVASGMLSPYRILEFNGFGPPLVYSERREAAVFTDDVDVHVLLFDQLTEAALSADDSTELIRDIAATYSSKASTTL